MQKVSRKLLSTSHLPFIPPLKPTLSARPPEGEGWLHEIKHDGYRTELIVENGGARAFTGRSDFHALRHALSAAPHRIVFFAFDLLHLDGEDFRKLPLAEKRARLWKLLGKRKAHDPLQLSEAIEGSGAEVFRAAEALGCEGIVSKGKASRYKSGASHAWLKTKCTQESEFIVVGAEPNAGGPPYALLAREMDGTLVYAGSAFVTLTAPDRDRFWENVEAMKVPRPAVRDIIRRKAAFVKPTLRVRARHMRGEDMLRHASVSRLLF